jgi:UDP-2,3-diacylglucosamine pyrophosphatase LpxH
MLRAIKSENPDTAFRSKSPKLKLPFPDPGEPKHSDEETGHWKRHVRSVWISDTHLGTKGCKADYLLDFLKNVQCRHLFLVGDIIDGWQIKRKGPYWSQAQTDVIRRVMKCAKKGTQVYYIPGNHDEALRDYLDIDIAGIHVVEEAIHKTADGRKLLILHGDAFDSVVRYARWLAFLGDYSYQFLLRLNHSVNTIRRIFGLPYWSLSAFLKLKVKNAVEFISRFEEAVAHEAAERGVDGVVCGHIHHAEIKEIQGITYYNDGDWVESCTALVEHFDGRMEILRWAEQDDVKARLKKRTKALPS